MLISSIDRLLDRGNMQLPKPGDEMFSTSAETMPDIDQILEE